MLRIASVFSEAASAKSFGDDAEVNTKAEEDEPQASPAVLLVDNEDPVPSSDIAFAHVDITSLIKMSPNDDPITTAPEPGKYMSMLTLIGAAGDGIEPVEADADGESLGSEPMVTVEEGVGLGDLHFERDAFCEVVGFDVVVARARSDTDDAWLVFDVADAVVDETAVRVEDTELVAEEDPETDEVALRVSCIERVENILPLAVGFIVVDKEASAVIV